MMQLVSKAAEWWMAASGHSKFVSMVVQTACAALLLGVEA